MNWKTLQVDRNQLGTTRVAVNAAAELQDGEILVKVDRFALTANNITYGAVGEKIGYWKFFPAEDNWGVIPVWGFATVSESRHPDVGVGERLYGYFPMGTHLVMTPGKVSTARLHDAAAHRAELPPVYNSYARVTGEAHYDASLDNERMLLMPLYATSYCLQDFLEFNDDFGASQIIVGSASSKTAIGLAYALADRAEAPHVIGLTSAGNAAFVRGLGLYDSVATYDAITDIDNCLPTVIVDMSGNGVVLSELHAHLGDNMKFTSNVGLTHVEDNTMGPDFIHERSAMFFAPAHIQKRRKELEPGEFEAATFKFWYRAALRSRDWLDLDVFDGMDALERAYLQLLGGGTSPDKGVVVEL